MPWMNSIAINEYQENMTRANRSPSGPPPTTIETNADRATEHDPHSPSGKGSPQETLSKLEKIRSFARKTKEKVLNPDDDKEVPVHDAVDHIASDPAFNPSLVLDKSTLKPKKDGPSSTKSELKTTVNTIAHPRQAIQGKAISSAAGKVSRAQRPFLSTEQDRIPLAVHNEVARLSSNRSSTGSQNPVRTAKDIDGEEEAARQKLESLEEQRASFHAAWTLGKHVDRVKIVQARVPKALTFVDFVETTSSGESGRFQWERWLGYQALYHTRGFTAGYIDDLEELPFDIEDLSGIIERLILVSTPWQAWFMSVHQIYTWQDPKRTAKWFALFCFLWYTEHIVGFLYAHVIYTVLKKKYYPTSIESVRHSMKRGIDREDHAKAWSELVAQHGRKHWIEPLLDELGPYLQLQLGDLANLLEVLVNFYRWKSPWKTAETLFCFGCCLLVTLLTDMAFCMKIFWFVIGGWFFLGFPVATRYPKYRHLVNPMKWMFWDIPTDAEWSIEFLQRKALKQQKQFDRSEHIENGDAFSDSESSYSGDDTPRAPSRQGSQYARAAPYGTEIFRFRAYQSRNQGHLHISRSGIKFTSRHRTWSIPYNQLIEMCKLRPDTASKAAATNVADAGLQFLAIDIHGARLNESITCNGDKRDEIFKLVLGWSGLTWRALCADRQKANISNGKIMKQLRDLLE
jgi:hypothetical protein